MDRRQREARDRGWGRERDCVLKCNGVYRTTENYLRKITPHRFPFCFSPLLEEGEVYVGDRILRWKVEFPQCFPSFPGPRVFE